MGSNRNRETRFQFKQFCVSDKYCAMKVGTDSVLLGAWVNVADDTRVLDVGSGSGILSLMVAQRSNASVVGIELDEKAVAESWQNVANSPWHDRITIVYGNFHDKITSLSTFDHVISNPPFFISGLKAPNTDRAIARQGDGLTYESIITTARTLLGGQGKLSFISPVEQKDEVLFYADLAKLYLARLTEVSSVVGKDPIRLLWEFSTDKVTTVCNQIAISDMSGRYTKEYIALTGDFYLNM